MALKLYTMHVSPPCRAVLITAKALNVPLDIVLVREQSGELRSEEFIKLNPQHTVPVLIEDNGLVICDSHAINAYLTGKYGKDDSLYPRDLYQRAMVDEKLHFDSGAVFCQLKILLYQFMNGDVTSVPAEKVECFEKIYETLERMLKGNVWVTGNNLTIADFSLFATITSSEVFVKITPKNYPNIIGWIKRISELPWFDVDGDQNKLDHWAKFCERFF